MIQIEEQRQILSDAQKLISYCIEVINYRYDIGVSLSDKRYPDGYDTFISPIEIRISRAIEEFNGEYDWESEIAQAIGNKPNNEVQRYIFDILSYFKGFSDAYYPYVLIDRWGGYISEYKGLLNAITDETEKAACDKAISMYEKQIQQAQEAAAKYADIALTFKYSGEAEKTFQQLVWWVHRFANILDAELAKHGIDFMQLQKTAGIYVKTRVYSAFTRKTDIMDLVGSYELADHYINALQVQANENKYSKELLTLFHGRTELINKLIGKSDDEIAALITGWATQRDNLGRPLIENPKNRKRAEFAEILKQNNLIKLSAESFRKKL